MRPTSALVVLASLLYTPGCVRHDRAVVSSRVVVRQANTIGNSFGEELAAEYNRATSQFQVQLVEMVGVANISAVAHDDADVTTASADAVYSAYQNSLQNEPGVSRQILAMAVLQVTALHLLVRDDSPVRSLSDLRGAAVAAFRGPLLNLLFEPGGLNAPSTWRYAPSSSVEAAGFLNERRVDAAFVGAYYPSPAVRTAILQGAHLIPVEGTAVERVRRRHRLIRQVTIPGNVYPKHPAPIHTIGVDTVYVCRSDLPESVVYNLTKELFDVLPVLVNRYGSLRVFDVEQAPATPIPLHGGAARYYRELELSR